MIGALLIVITCIYLGLYLLKRTTMKRKSGKSGHLLEVLETSYVAPKKTVALIRVADKAVLVGMTDNGMSALTELDATQTAEITASQTEVEEPDRFAQLLKSVSQRVRQVSMRKNSRSDTEWNPSVADEISNPTTG